jgi:hypothetical protein
MLIDSSQKQGLKANQAAKFTNAKTNFFQPEKIDINYP